MQKKCISTVLWQNPIKHRPNIHQMYSTVSIGPSHMENSIKFSTPFPPSLKGSSPTIHCGTFSFYCLLIFFIKKVQAPLKRYIISIIPAKPPHLLFFHFWQNSISRAPFFPHIGTPPQRYIQFQYSFELWCSSFNGIRTLTDWFINNFLFWWSPRFFIFDLPKKLMHFNGTPFPQNKSRRHMNPAICN